MTIDHTSLPCEAEWGDKDEYPAWEDLMRHLATAHGKRWTVTERADGANPVQLKRLWTETHPDDRTVNDDG